MGKQELGKYLQELPNTLGPPPSYVKVKKEIMGLFKIPKGADERNSGTSAYFNYDFGQKLPKNYFHEISSQVENETGRPP